MLHKHRPFEALLELFLTKFENTKRIISEPANIAFDSAPLYFYV